MNYFNLGGKQVPACDLPMFNFWNSPNTEAGMIKYGNFNENTLQVMCRELFLWCRGIENENGPVKLPVEKCFHVKLITIQLLMAN